MKPIETTYKGYRFRSRLEARWAVFLDSLGYQWQYEPEGFELSDGTKYLPDFYIQGIDTNNEQFCFWLEVKPEQSTDDSKPKKFALELPDNEYILFADGIPIPNKAYECFCNTGLDMPRMIWSNRRRPWLCYDDANIEIQHQRVTYHGNYPATLYWLRDVMQASIKARSARFEYGDRGSC